MNIWIEYFKFNDSRKNNHAQMRENAHWVQPDPEKVIKRFCQSREDANKYAKSLNDQGYHVTIKTDGAGGAIS